MKLSPLQSRGSFFTDVEIHALPKAKNEDLSRIDIVVEPDVICPEPAQPLEWVVYLSVKLCSKEGIIAPYSGQVEAFGSFSVDKNWPEKMRERLVYINGSGLIYATIREMICTITARGFFDMYVLPSWSFSDMYKELEEARNLKAGQSSLPLDDPPKATDSVNPSCPPSTLP